MSLILEYKKRILHSYVGEEARNLEIVHHKNIYEVRGMVGYGDELKAFHTVICINAFNMAILEEILHDVTTFIKLSDGKKE